MDKEKLIGDFKQFVKLKPELNKAVLNGEVSWQSLFETYALYGEDSEVWDDYNEEVNFSVSDVFKMLSKMDVQKVQKNITSLQKALEIVEEIVVDKSEVPKSTYQPRPYYKYFDD